MGMNPWIWGIIGLAVGVVELAAPGFFLIFLALGGLITALVVALWPLTLEMQLLVFAAASILCASAGLRFYRRVLRGRQHPTLNSPTGMIGARGVVEDDIREGRGKVRLADTVWLASGIDLRRGEPVEVTGVHGTVVAVKPLR